MSLSRTSWRRSRRRFLGNRNRRFARKGMERNKEQKNASHLFGPTLHESQHKVQRRSATTLRCVCVRCDLALMSMECAFEQYAKYDTPDAACIYSSIYEVLTLTTQSHHCLLLQNLIWKGYMTTHFCTAACPEGKLNMAGRPVEWKNCAT